jgi:hypothetical protein
LGRPDTVPQAPQHVRSLGYLGVQQNGATHAASDFVFVFARAQRTDLRLLEAVLWLRGRLQRALRVLMQVEEARGAVQIQGGLKFLSLGSALPYFIYLLYHNTLFFLYLYTFLH